MADARSRLGWLGQVVAWMVILGVAVALAAAVLVPRLAGATPYTVLTGSMDPTYPPGTLVVVKPVPVEEIRTGDVVTYQLESGKPAVVTHRVVEVGTSLEGEISLTTQGDANDVADSERVQAVQLKGRVWYAAPHLGRVNSLVTGDRRQLVVYVVGGGLLAYAGYMFTSSIRDRRRAPAAAEADVSGGPMSHAGPTSAEERRT